MSSKGITIQQSMNLYAPHEIVGACEFGNIRHVDVKNGSVVVDDGDDFIGV